MSKSERRELQESQRAAKAVSKEDGDGGGPRALLLGHHSDGGSKGQGAKLKAAPAKDVQAAAPLGTAPSLTGSIAAGTATLSAAASGAAGPGGLRGSKRNQGETKVVSPNSSELFAHLQQYKKMSVGRLLEEEGEATKHIHPVILQLGLQYADASIRGGNARCMAMLSAFLQVIRDFTPPEGRDFGRELSRYLSDMVGFLVLCRPMSMSMGNAVRHCKVFFTTKLQKSADALDLPETEARRRAIKEVESYIQGRIISADKQLIQLATSKVDNGDVILTYAASYCVTCALTDAVKAGKRFRVVVMDSRPECEGEITLRQLLDAGIPCTYVHLNAASYIIREATKVFLGAAAVLGNGTVLSRAGSAAVAMMAHAQRVPVMICCETHKFNERVQLDSITHNELGDPATLANLPGGRPSTHLLGWQGNGNLKLLNIKYDIMPSEYVTMIVTEFGMIPPTSVPVIIREFRSEPGQDGHAMTTY